MSVKERMTVLLPWGGKSMNVYCAKKAAFFPQARLQPQKLALHTILRIELSSYTFSDPYVLLKGSKLESHRKRVLFAHLGSMSSFFKIHRHLKGSRLDWRLPKEIECKLATSRFRKVLQLHLYPRTTE